MRINHFDFPLNINLVKCVYKVNTCTNLFSEELMHKFANN